MCILLLLVCACMCLYLHVHVCMHTCICIPVHVHIHICVILYLVSALHAYVSLDSICIVPYVSMFVHTKHRHACVCTHLCVYMCESCINMSVYRCACVSVCGHACWIPLGMRLCFRGDYSHPSATCPTLLHLGHRLQPSTLESASYIVPKSHGEQLYGASVFMWASGDIYFKMLPIFTTISSNNNSS